MSQTHTSTPSAADSIVPMLIAAVSGALVATLLWMAVSRPATDPRPPVARPMPALGPLTLSDLGTQQPVALDSAPPRAARENVASSAPPESAQSEPARPSPLPVAPARAGSVGAPSAAPVAVVPSVTPIGQLPAGTLGTPLVPGPAVSALPQPRTVDGVIVPGAVDVQAQEEQR